MLEHRIIRRLFAIAPLCALTACATTGSAQSSELAELKAEVRAMRETQARLEKRLERVELHASVNQSRAASAPAREASASAAPSSPASSGSGYSTPELAVVKLKPRNEPAPPLPVRVAVVEPAPDDMEMFISSAPEGDAAPATAEVSEPMADELAIAALDAEFEQAVAALRTGNVEGGVTRLRSFAEQNPRHPRADNALYFSGLGQMGLKDHASAAKSFERLIASYPAGDAVLDGMLRLAECRLRLNQKDDARALYTRILTQFPGTAAATQAEQRLASLSP
ncbi:tetratricopeptide repeat protein [Archangium gephyra]|uniref:TPR repeat containing exported protein n=1 Tax=Archangium gephyra TaxID=48 RepID=A0AAC8TGD4_9BACT|nr:tetratricopeptide repeat protein [Archangium gephyra]AKJ05042.1 TPR repeat containing exported protein [Archangium gephyra]REG35745.1 tetratricopeptide repeat protein [Archangium gephyra]